jgi:hypothetical protein
MRFARCLVPGVLIAALLAPPAGAQTGVTITAGAERLNPGETTTIRIEIDIVTTNPFMPGGGGDPYFQIHMAGVTTGRLTQGTISANGEWFPPGGTGFILHRDRDPSWRGRSDGPRLQALITVLYQAPSDPGEVLITVDGGRGMSALGAEAQGGGDRSRSQLRLFIVGAPGSGVGQPATQVPFEPTAGTVNVTPEIIKRLIPIIAILAAAGVVTQAGRKGRPATEKPSGPADPTFKADPLKPATRAEEPIVEKADTEEPPSAGIHVHVRPTHRGTAGPSRRRDLSLQGRR